VVNSDMVLMGEALVVEADEVAALGDRAPAFEHRRPASAWRVRPRSKPTGSGSSSGSRTFTEPASGFRRTREPAHTGTSPPRLLFCCRHAGTKGADMTDVTERAVLAGGCFWGVQELVRKQPGVISTRVGYTGGDVPNATYRNHGTHAEALEITFDPSQTSFRDLLEFFFQIHDPTTVNRQGNDVGLSYRSAIYYTSDEQRKVAEDTIADVDASGLWPGKVVTEVEPEGPFWEAEPEHQDYLQHYPNGYTCHFVRPNWKLPHRETAS
jgi:peptide-methionine (S)-S-oxide reductase